MAELFMECEEEELEPWQKGIKEVEADDDDDDDEPIFVGEISSSKPSSLTSFKPSSQHYMTPASTPVALSPVALSPIFQPVPRSPTSPVVVQPLARPGSISGTAQPLPRSLAGCLSSGLSQPVTIPVSAEPVLRNNTVPLMPQPGSGPVAPAQSIILNQGYLVSSPQVVPNNSSGILFGLRQSPGVPQYQGGPVLTLTGPGESSFGLKRPSTSEVSSVTLKKLKPNESVPVSSTPSLAPSVKSPTAASSQSSPLKGVNSSTSHAKNGAPFPRACPKCNIHFNLMDPLKNHMKYCCPDMIDNFFLGVDKTELSSTSKIQIADSEKGKLIMLVNEFYYGKHEGEVLQEQKTHTTFKCASCLKILKNNIRFMNHMKHHLEIEKRSNESWENHTTCQHCYRQFPTPFQLQCHIESAHSPYESSTICKICELAFDTEQILLQHMKDNHKPGEMPYVCQVCSYRSSSFSDVESHFRTAHENTKNLLCPFCLKVIKTGTPYMHHYMRHQKKGVYRCTKCRLQFLTCKEKMDHKTQLHRTFRKPKQLEGLPPGTKVTIRASVGVPGGLSVTPSISTSTSTLQLSPPRTKTSNTKTHTKSLGNKSRSRAKTSNVPKKQNTWTASTTKSNKAVNTALQNIRCLRGVHKCIECCSEIKDFANHFPTYVHCSLCRYNTSCSKAYVNHMMSFHSARPSKRFQIFKKHSEELRGISAVCLNCDFLADGSGLDSLASHLCEKDTHTCQVVLEKVSIGTSSPENLSELKNEITGTEQESQLEKNSRPNTSDGKTGTSASESKAESGSSGEAESKSIGQPVQVSLEVKNEERRAASAMKGSSAQESQDKGSKLCLCFDLHPSDDGAVKKAPRNCTCGESELQTYQSTEAPNPNDQTKDSSFGDARPSGRNTKELKLTVSDVSFEQFLRKGDEPDSLSSDISEQGSILLEPLTPSEVLEHEATEILQKGALAKKAGLAAEQTDDIPRGSSPGTTKTAGKQTEEKEAS
ncbi:zinc finger protein 280D isoform X2 [Tachyglossus aculeatus]|uniref:zinc finger protein 280D isoform X2 n=1 Tax=Tachyglossus aculeatus TaxID=9261 RepID=UPI0018F39EF8|nr:zinc finger protein 280D isoform X2 [Tachyglossus aculeatus]